MGTATVTIPMEVLMKKLSALLLVILCLSGCASEQVSDASPIERDRVIIALLDTGISTTAIPSESLLPGHNYVTNTDDTEDRINHGTAVASVILGCESAGVKGVAPSTFVVPLVIADKVEGEMVTATPDVLAGAIRDSVDKYGACIINVSLGIKKDDPAVKAAVAYVQKQGALVIAAAGNGGDSEELYYPAAYDGVLTVGSHDKDLKVSSFTQQNGTVDILAPGEDIWLASRNGVTYGARGTSYATGFVSAAAALLWQADLTQTPEEISQTILSSAQTVDGWQILTHQP
jgi:subtilisin family serine protease